MPRTKGAFAAYHKKEVIMEDFASYQGKNAQEPVDWEGEAKKIASRYRGKGDGDILKEIFARAAEGKKNGTLTNEQIDAFYHRFAPMLDGAKRKKLDKLVRQLKEM